MISLKELDRNHASSEDFWMWNRDVNINWPAISRALRAAKALMSDDCGTRDGTTHWDELEAAMEGIEDD